MTEYVSVVETIGSAMTLLMVVAMLHLVRLATGDEVSEPQGEPAAGSNSA